MNILVEYFVSGKSFFAGDLMIIFAAFLSCAHERLFFRVATSAMLILGLLFMIFSGVPISWIPFVLVAAAVAIIFFFSQYEKASNRIFFWSVRGGLVAVMLAMLINETKYLRIPSLDSREYKKMYVIGTGFSMSENNGRSYVDILHDRYRLNIFNLSEPGNTTKKAMSQAEMLSSGDILILIELGMEEDFLEYKTFLKQLLSQLTGKNRTVVMFELPRLSGDGNYAEAQRELAAQYKVKLIPKKVLASAIYDWHSRRPQQLADEAHDWLAKLLAPRLENCIKKREAMAPVVPLKPSKRVLRVNTNVEEEEDED